MTSLQRILDDFHENLVIFVDELVEQFPKEADFIIVRLMIKDTIPPEKILKGFITEILPYKSDIQKRDESLFLDSKISILGALSSNKVNHFKLLWKSAALTEDDKNTIWAWFETFVFFAEQYQKAKLQK